MTSQFSVHLVHDAYRRTLCSITGHAYRSGGQYQVYATAESRAWKKLDLTSDGPRRDNHHITTTTTMATRVQLEKKTCQSIRILVVPGYNITIVRYEIPGDMQVWLYLGKNKTLLSRKHKLITGTGCLVKCPKVLLTFPRGKKKPGFLARSKRKIVKEQKPQSLHLPPGRSLNGETETTPVPLHYNAIKKLDVELFDVIRTGRTPLTSGRRRTVE